MAPPVVTKVERNASAMKKGNGLPENGAVFSRGLCGELLIESLRPEKRTPNTEGFIVEKSKQVFRIESAGHSPENPDGFPRLVEISSTIIKPPFDAFGPEVGGRGFWPNQKPI